jgi:CcmD family protein
MSNKILKTFTTTFFALITSLAFAQPDVEMADKMRSEGKIYVVVAILTMILVGLLLYVFFTDRKLSRLEKKIQEKKS